jgi:hypothetical protein
LASLALEAERFLRESGLVREPGVVDMGQLANLVRAWLDVWCGACSESPGSLGCECLEAEDLALAVRDPLAVVSLAFTGYEVLRGRPISPREARRALEEALHPEVRSILEYMAGFLLRQALSSRGIEVPGEASGRSAA